MRWKTSTPRSLYELTASGPSTLYPGNGDPKPTTALSITFGGWSSILLSKPPSTGSKRTPGTEGNEKADKLAKQGRSLAAANGGRDYTAPPLIPEDAETGSFAQLEKALHNAAVDTFKVHPFRKRTPWIRDETLTALTAARTAEADHSPDAKTLRNKAKRMARKDRIHWVHQQLQSDPSGEHGVIWKTIKNQKKGFVGKNRIYFKMENRYHGRKLT